MTEHTEAVPYAPAREGEVLEPGTLATLREGRVLARFTLLIALHAHNLEREMLGLPPLPVPPREE